MNSSEIVERLRFQATGTIEPEHTIMLATASYIEAQDKLLSEMADALKQERVMRMIAEGAGVEQAKIHAQVKADQDAMYIRIALSQTIGEK